MRADSWSENFSVKGLLAATGSNGSQSRNIMSISDDLFDALALWIGAPLQAGGMLLEP